MSTHKGKLEGMPEYGVVPRQTLNSYFLLLYRKYIKFWLNLCSFYQKYVLVHYDSKLNK